MAQVELGNWGQKHAVQHIYVKVYRQMLAFWIASFFVEISVYKLYFPVPASADNDITIEQTDPPPTSIFDHFLPEMYVTCAACSNSNEQSSEAENIVPR